MMKQLLALLLLLMTALSACAGLGEEAAPLPDGRYSVRFSTDSSMFRVNEACEGRGILTVQDGVMTLHVSLMSKKILHLFPGLAADAKLEGAQLLEPTLDEITYSDGYTETVYGLEFDLALIGTKGKWYDHKVAVSDPIPVE